VNYKRHPLFIMMGLCVVLLTLAVINIGLGAVPIPPLRVISSLIGLGEYNETYIIVFYRLPRIVLALLVGGCLAVAGVIAQSILRNPLAAPDTLGITGGASIGAIGFSLLFPAASPSLTGIAAFIGGTIAAAAVYLLTYQRTGTEPARLALVGVSVSAFCGSCVELFILKMNTNLQTSLLWLNGSLFGRTWQSVIDLLPWAVILITVTLFLAKTLDIFILGKESAIGLGIKTETATAILMGLSVLLTGASVAAAGMIGFVGLISPHIARKLVGTVHHYLIPTTTLIGAIMLLFADCIGRGIIPPIEIPAGIVTALIGAPYFLFLLWKQSSKKGLLTR